MDEDGGIVGALTRTTMDRFLAPFSALQTNDLFDAGSIVEVALRIDFRADQQRFVAVHLASVALAGNVGRGQYQRLANACNGGERR